MQLNIEYIKLFEHEEEEDYQLKNILIKLRHRGHPHSTYTQKSPKLRPVYTFLYIIINDNVIASFVQKKIVLRFCGPIIVFLRTYATLSPPPIPPTSLYAIVRI